MAPVMGTKLYISFNFDKLKVKLRAREVAQTMEVPVPKAQGPEFGSPGATCKPVVKALGRQALVVSWGSLTS